MLARRITIAMSCAAVVAFAGVLLPENAAIPVEGATRKDWNPKSFWYEPWGTSGVHKGIDVFAPQGTKVLSAVSGVVIYQGQLGIGGNVVAVLGPKWRVHYYAHLAEVTRAPRLVGKGMTLGAVGAV